jgi:ubiquinone/menaquinone biosynthesis C-methylase UbiE
MMSGESKYVERKNYLSRYVHATVLASREAQLRKAALAGRTETEWLKMLKEELPKFIPFLTEKCGLEFRGRVLEIGAGGAWLSAELSKLPGVVEVVATDILPDTLKEQAPKIFKLLKANCAKIIRTPADFHDLKFPDNHFDFVVCSAGLRHAANMVQVLREAKRVLKPGGKFVAIREPVAPRVQLPSREKAEEEAQGSGPFYTLPHYRELFAQAALPVEVKRVNLSSGFRFLVDEMVNGITDARYAFIGSKRVRSSVAKPGPKDRR